jgi:hypothetical protein
MGQGSSSFPTTPIVQPLAICFKKGYVLLIGAIFGPLCSQWMFPQVRNGHWECNGGLDWQGMVIGNAMGYEIGKQWPLQTQ